jgi:hypothetical protein
MTVVRYNGARAFAIEGVMQREQDEVAAKNWDDKSRDQIDLILYCCLINKSIK